MHPEIRHAYACARRDGRPALEAFNRAKAAPKPLPAYTLPADAFRIWRKPIRNGAPDKSGLCWIEDPAACGLRFAGYADELAEMRHTGWYTFPGGDDGETLRGAVYRLPARDGAERFVSGYVESWGDGARLDLGRNCIADVARDAALHADGIAEREAEKERDYRQAWMDGRDARDAAREPLALATRLREELRAMTDACSRGAFKAAAMLATRAAATWDEMREAREEARDKRRDAPTWAPECDAWREGYEDV